MLCIFADGSLDGCSGRSFVRYKDTEGKWKSMFLAGTNKLTAAGSNTAVKSEVDSLLISLRLAKFVTKNMDSVRFSRIILFSDSEIACGALTSDTITQKLFFSTRMFEAQQIFNDLNCELYHVPSLSNESDFSSKLNLKQNFMLTERWWKSEFLMKEEEEWPVKKYVFQDVHVQCIQNPKMIPVEMKLSSAEASESSIGMKLSSVKASESFIEKLTRRFSSFKKLLKCVSILFHWKVNSLVESLDVAKMFILSKLHLSAEEISGIKRQHKVIFDKENSLHYLIPRNYKVGGKVIEQKLILVSSKENVSKLILNDCHVHCSSIQHEISRMFSRGFYVLKCRKLFEDLQLSCTMCRRLRKVTWKHILGPTHSLQAARCGPLNIVCCDVLGPMKQRLTRNISSKLFVLVISCIYSRYTMFVGLEDMSSNSILMALRTAFNNIGRKMCSVIYSDHASNFTTMVKLQNENDENVISNLKKVFYKNNISWKAGVPHAPYRQSNAESMVKVFKSCLKRTNLYNKAFSLKEWNYILSKISLLANQRPLSVNYLNQNFSYLTPNMIVFGSKSQTFPVELCTEAITNEKLFRRMIAIDQELETYLGVWQQEYFHNLRKWTKWRFGDKLLQPGDIVLVIDKLSPFTHQPILARVKTVLSERSYRVEYVKKAATINKETYQIEKHAKISTLDRPATSLCLVLENECKDENISLEIDEKLFDEETNLSPLRGEVDTALLDDTDVRAPERENIGGLETLDDNNVLRDPVEVDSLVDENNAIADPVEEDTVINESKQQSGNDREKLKVKFYDEGEHTINDIKQDRKTRGRKRSSRM